MLPHQSELVENAEVALNNHDYDHIDKITKCITNQIKKLKAGEELDDVSAILGPPDKRKIADKETSPSKVPIAQEKPESEVEADKNLINNLKLALSKAINDLNTLLESGVNVSKVQEKIGNVDNFIKNNDPEEAENLLIQINKEIEDLKKPQTEDLEVTANNLMQKMMVKLSEAMNNELPVKEASDLINYAKQRMKRNSYGEVIEI